MSHFEQWVPRRSMSSSKSNMASFPGSWLAPAMRRRAPGRLVKARRLAYLAAMAVRPILIHPDPRLRKVAAPVEAVDEGLRALAEDMLATMYEAPGIGLAATQLGVMQRVFVMDCAGKDEPPQPMVLVNPEIVWRSEETETSEEGCLSIPDVYEDVTRAERVRVRWLGLDGEVHEREFGERWAVCAQHEIDHLDGRLFIDYLERGEADDDHLADEEAEEGEGAGLSAAPVRAMRLDLHGNARTSRCRRSMRWSRPGTRSPASTPSRRGPAGAGSGRGRARSQARAAALGLEVRAPASLKRPGGGRRRSRRSAPRSAVVAAYGLILPQAVLDAPARGCLNIHASLLPRWRGAAPIQRAIMAGDAETGVSIMAMEAGLDTGPVLLAEARADRAGGYRGDAARPAGGAWGRG